MEKARTAARTANNCASVFIKAIWLIALTAFHSFDDALIKVPSEREYFDASVTCFPFFDPRVIAG